MKINKCECVMSVRNVVSALTVAATGLFIPASVSADEMALTLKAQGITLVGQFGGFEDGTYVLVMDAGTIYVPAVLVTCEGDDCFELVDLQATAG